MLALTPGTSASAPAGTLDTSFGTNGVVRRNVSGSFVSSDQGNAILVQPDGKVLVAGAGGTPNSNFVLMRVLADGTPDTSFGTNGLTDNSFSSTYSGANAVALQPDGKIVAGGFSSVGLSHHLAIARYLPNGALDTSFSGDGLVTGVVIEGNQAELVTSLVVQPDGRIVTVGQSTSGSATEVVRFNTNGSVDTSFGTSGHVLLSALETASIALQSDGRIIVAAGTIGAPYKAIVTRLTTTGAVDTTFGGSGTGRATVGTHASDTATALVIGPGDAITIGGKGASGFGSEIAVARLTADGALDTGFGTGGYTNLTVSDSYVAVRGLALQADGRLLAVGGAFRTNAYQWFVVRYTNAGAVDTTFAGGGLVAFETGDAMAVAVGADGAFVTGYQGPTGDLTIYKFGIGTVAPPTTTTNVPSPTTSSPTFTTTTSAPVGGGSTIGSRFVPVSPTRLLDTRLGAHKVHPGASIDVDVTRIVPRTATAVVVNVTATEADGPGYITVWPAGSTRPDASSLNIASASGTIANLVTMPVTASGALSLFTESGTHLLVDVLGYYAPVTTAVAGGRFQAVPAVRVLDTRALGDVAPSTADFSVDAVPGIPKGRASAVVLNLTATAARRAGFVTVWPIAAGGQPSTSNLNLDDAGQTRANQVIVAVGDSTIRLATASGAHLIVDVVGYLTDDAAPVSTSGLFVSFTPRRVLDTRAGIGVPIGIIEPAGTRVVEVRSRIPVTGIAAVVGNVTASQSTSPGYVTVWPHVDGPRPEVSTLNLDAVDQTRANHAIVAVGPDGAIAVHAERGTHAIIDLAGAFRA